MKKNVMMRLACFLLVAVLISTSAISGTYAKYVTSETGTDSARVAKWGVTIIADGETFAETYETDDTTYAETNSVISTAGDVVAPGTSGELAGFTINGTPEVATRITYSANFDIGENWMVDADNNDVSNVGAYYRDTFYCPIIIIVEGTKINGLTYDKAEDFEKDVNDAIKAFTQDYKANEAIAAEKLDVSWKWAFDAEDPDAIPENNDEYDTQLGDAAVYMVAPTISLEVTCTVTQID